MLKLKQDLKRNSYFPCELEWLSPASIIFHCLQKVLLLNDVNGGTMQVKKEFLSLAVILLVFK